MKEGVTSVAGADAIRATLQSWPPSRCRESRRTERRCSPCRRTGAAPMRSAPERHPGAADAEACLLASWSGPSHVNRVPCATGIP